MPNLKKPGREVFAKEVVYTQTTSFSIYKNKRKSEYILFIKKITSFPTERSRFEYGVQKHCQ